jgi:hypothetical protein
VNQKVLSSTLEMFPERCGGAANKKRKEGWCVSKNKIQIL